MKIAIIGGGPAAVALLDALAVSADEAGARPGPLTVFEPSPWLWRGRPYAPDLDSVLVNAIPQLMSIRGADFGHYSGWLGERGAQYLDTRLGQPLVPRALYGEYLVESAEAALAALRGRGWETRVVRARITGATRHEGMIVLRTDAGQEHRVSRLALCVGGGTPPDLYNLADRPGYIHDPYPLARTLGRIPVDSTVSVLGSGLTAVDIAVSLAARGHTGPVTLLSRTGTLPHVWQRPIPRTPTQLTGERISALYREQGSVTLADLADLMEAELADTGESFDDLAAEFLNSDHPVTRLRSQLEAIDDPRIGRRVLQESAHRLGPSVWPLLPDDDRARLRQHFRTATAIASPMIPVNAVTVLEMLDTGRLELLRGVRAVESVAGRFRIEHGAGDHTADIVVNAVNPPPQAIPAGARPLVDALATAGLAARHPEGGIVPADPCVHIVGDLHGGGSFITTGIAGLAARAVFAARALHGADGQPRSAAGTRRSA
ncbi:FAD/NAD(P)-binding protein [Nocardia carnea]|uniref:FAD/NAD(P)-binding protein n=1 Tax=Nocardia carnea TaxID=37328 RepID=UPI002457C7B3|nr:FAD/NAD(P)-binding protein [Nocardia carnea]